MSLASKLNKIKGVSPFSGVKVEDYLKLQDLDQDQLYSVLGCYINKKNKFGDEPVLITTIDSKNYGINLPRHLLDDIKYILDDDSIIEDIYNQKLGFQVGTYQNSRGKFYTINWVDR